MSINLVKGSSIDLRKTTDNESVLSKVTIGLGWDPSSHSQSFDLDASALLLQGGKLVSDDDIVYYRKQQHKSGLVYSSGDNLTGAGDGDDEQIIAKLSSLDSKYDKIIHHAGAAGYASRYGEGISSLVGYIRYSRLRVVCRAIAIYSTCAKKINQ